MKTVVCHTQRNISVVNYGIRDKFIFLTLGLYDLSNGPCRQFADNNKAMTLHFVKIKNSLTVLSIA